MELDGHHNCGTLRNFRKLGFWDNSNQTKNKQTTEVMETAGSEYVTNISSFSVKSITRFKKKSGKKRIERHAEPCALTQLLVSLIFLFLFLTHEVDFVKRRDCS